MVRNIVWLVSLLIRLLLTLVTDIGLCLHTTFIVETEQVMSPGARQVTELSCWVLFQLFERTRVKMLNYLLKGGFGGIYLLKEHAFLHV